MTKYTRTGVNVAWDLKMLVVGAIVECVNPKTNKEELCVVISPADNRISTTAVKFLGESPEYQHLPNNTPTHFVDIDAVTYKRR